MQKIVLRQNLKNLIYRTKSEDIINFFENANRKDSGYSTELLSLIVESKSGFDQSILDEKQEKILSQFDAHKYYSTNFHSKLILFISGNNSVLTKDYLQKSKEMNQFYTYHNTLLTSFKLIDNLLFQDSEFKKSINKIDFKEIENDGYLSFEIMTDNYVDFQRFAVITQNINELINLTSAVLQKIDKIEISTSPELILADSGSNTALSIKLPKEIAKSISKIIDDTWMLITNRDGYKLEKINKNLTESLEIMSKIKDAEEKKLIEPEQAEIWRKGISKSAENIVMNNALTKSKSEEMTLISNQKMLADATKKYLSEGNGKSAHNNV
jgi:hypothetical protein